MADTQTAKKRAGRRHIGKDRMTSQAPSNDTQKDKRRTIVRALQTLAGRPSRVVFYGAALLAIASIAPGAEIPAALAPLAPLIGSGVALGINVLADILGRAARGEDVRDEAMRAAVEHAVAQCSATLDDLLTNEDFQQALATQMRELRLLETLARENQVVLVEQLKEQAAQHAAY